MPASRIEMIDLQDAPARFLVADWLGPVRLTVSQAEAKPFKALDRRNDGIIAFARYEAVKPATAGRGATGTRLLSLLTPSFARAALGRCINARPAARPSPVAGDHGDRSQQRAGVAQRLKGEGFGQ